MTSTPTALPNAPAAAPQLLLILAGVVGSGKSTFSISLAKHLPGWARVNQDELGDRRACEEQVKMYLAQGLSVVLDRQNFDASQRRTWLEIAVDYPAVTVGCLVMGTTPQECYERLLVRTDHPTVQDARLGVELLNKFLGLWAEPRLDEGYDYLMTLPSLPNTPDLTPEFIESLIAALLRSRRNANGGRQRANLRRPAQGYGQRHQGGYGSGYGAQQQGQYQRGHAGGGAYASGGGGTW